VANIGKSFLVFCCGLTCFGEEFVFSIAPKPLFLGENFWGTLGVALTPHTLSAHACSLVLASWEPWGVIVMWWGGRSRIIEGRWWVIG
jgi:hypothetical protein